MARKQQASRNVGGHAVSFEQRQSKSNITFTDAVCLCGWTFAGLTQKAAQNAAESHLAAPEATYVSKWAAARKA
jgi:hypothetical protein